MSLPRCAKHVRILGANHQRRNGKVEISFTSLLLKNWKRAFFLRFFETQNDEVMVVGVALLKLVEGT